MKAFLFILLLLFTITVKRLPKFSAHDIVTVSDPVALINYPTAASNDYRSFCLPALTETPEAVNLGNIGGRLATPVFIDYVQYNGNYYGFLVNHDPGSLIRLDFGNSLLNAPNAVSLGNFGGIIPPGNAAEGIQVVENEGRWYAIIVAGYPPAGSEPRILKVDFGPDPANPSPVATDWGNLGNMLQPIDLHVFKEENNWYGFTVNAENNTITRFSFTNSFNNTPTAVNLGNIGNLNYPTGIYAINDDGNWRVFIANGGNNNRTAGASSLTRLDFGSSLLHTPAGTNLGNPGNVLQHPRDLTIIKAGGQIIGFAVNGEPYYNDVVRLNFNSNLSSTPVITSLGSMGGTSFPHSISKFFRVDNDIYSFVTNADQNTITRLKFSRCTPPNPTDTTVNDPHAGIIAVRGRCPGPVTGIRNREPVAEMDHVPGR